MVYTTWPLKQIE